MKMSRVLLIVLGLFLVASSTALAGDFDWCRDFNIRAEADPSGFRARLAARFQIGDLQIRTVLSNVERPADAYMVLKLGEMSGRPTAHVMEQYQSHKGKGWGVLAKSLGIKPGSGEFHALKRGQDLYDGDQRGKKDRGRGKGKGKGRK